jgi:hypothetical protein
LKPDSGAPVTTLQAKIRMFSADSASVPGFRFLSR